MKTSEQDGVLVAVITGELDMVSVDAVGTALFDHLGTASTGLVVELAVDFMGSSALSMMLKLSGQAQNKGVGFAIVAVQAAAARPLMASALGQVLPVADSVDEAVQIARKQKEAAGQPGR
ncbi:STAS domain-containing protein [Lentzea sp. HUAS12]|uniref:STAS domain-containing protein n=1 Tax=Lentzea sp. HUAS12 TaxID=2951806 RepID=UPI00209DE2E8|nr:STAS domain-containing protein [Lentzea sp. HUAS12]USX55529.1 STAS domain-containing protein [Lentzea sp. HUAS12]